MTPDSERGGPSLAGRQVYFVGRLMAMSLRDARNLVRQHGGVPAAWSGASLGNSAGVEDVAGSRMVAASESGELPSAPQPPKLVRRLFEEGPLAEATAPKGSASGKPSAPDDIADGFAPPGEPAAPPDEFASDAIASEDAIPWLVVGEHGLAGDDALAAARAARLISPAACEAADRGRLRILAETPFWQALGLIEGESAVRKLYTPAMLATLLGQPIELVRAWQRRGLIAPAQRVGRLAYYDFAEVAAARRLVQWHKQGLSSREIKRQLEGLRRRAAHDQQSLTQLPLVVRDREILLRHGDGLIDAGGQRRLDFCEPEDQAPTPTLPLREPAEDFCELEPLDGDPPERVSVDDLWDLANRLEEAGELHQAAELYRAALAVGGPDAEICFQLAELLYRLADLPAARERYYMAVEIDEEFVEARVNLGCVLAESGEHELAVAAFEGALHHHPDYADAHYHLARTLWQMGREPEALEHWRRFLVLSPASPWADEARQALLEERAEEEDG